MNIRFNDCEIGLLGTSRASDFFDLIDANRERLEDFFAGTVARTESLEDTEAYCDAVEARIREGSYLPYIISETDTGKYIGLVDVKSIEWSVPKAELGYFIDESYAGRGITSLAVGLVVDLTVSEHGFKKLLCRVNAENLASINVALKNGFELEGTIRRDYVTTSGEVVDLNYYGRVF